jgi:hypothetical protein
VPLTIVPRPEQHPHFAAGFPPTSRLNDDDPCGPRYTEHQIRNKESKDEILIKIVDDVGLGHETRMRWNARSEWVRSTEQVHAALVTEEDSEAAQAKFAQTARA